MDLGYARALLRAAPLTAIARAAFRRSIEKLVPRPAHMAPSFMLNGSRELVTR